MWVSCLPSAHSMGMEIYPEADGKGGRNAERKWLLHLWYSGHHELQGSVLSCPCLVIPLLGRGGAARVSPGTSLEELAPKGPAVFLPILFPISSTVLSPCSALLT